MLNKIIDQDTYYEQNILEYIYIEKSYSKMLLITANIIMFRNQRNVLQVGGTNSHGHKYIRNRLPNRAADSPKRGTHNIGTKSQQIKSYWLGLVTSYKIIKYA